MITSEEYGNYDTFLEYYKYNDSIKTQARVETTRFYNEYSTTKYTHRANLIDLEFNTTYHYQYKIGNDEISSLFHVDQKIKYKYNFV